MVLDQARTKVFNGITYDASHGSPFDRGSADSWYSRPQDPHKGGVGGDSGPRVEAQDMYVSTGPPAELIVALVSGELL